MSTWLSEREQRLVAGAEAASAATPIPTQIVSNGEYLPPPQSATQKKVEARINELADQNGKHLGLSRRQFLHTGCGMAAAFLAMNDIYGNVFQVAAAEAREPELMLARAQGLAGYWAYDLALHRNLLSILEAEREALSATESLPVSPDWRRLRAA
jgi:hypothetical protein